MSIRIEITTMRYDKPRLAKIGLKAKSKPLEATIKAQPEKGLLKASFKNLILSGLRFK